MTTEKEDTDPSTPASLRPGGMPRGYGLRELAAREPLAEDPNRPTTNPGLGPAPRTRSEPPPASGRRGVVVPPPSGLGPNAVTPAAGMRAVPTAPASAALSSAVARAKDSKDSVELLLDGMAGPRPERRKTTPQSDGEASASYHARHGLHPAYALHEPGPKVVVDRTPAPPLSEPDTLPTPAPPVAGASDTTFVPARNQARRIAMAILVALLMVLAIFVAMDLVAPKRASGPSPSGAPSDEGPQPTAIAQAAAPGFPGATSPLAAASLPGVPSPPAPAPAASAMGAPESTLMATTHPAATPSASAAANESAAQAKPAVGAPQAEGTTKRRRRAAGSTDDVGEFKTSF